MQAFEDIEQEDNLNLSVYNQIKNAYLSKKESEDLFLSGVRNGVEKMTSRILFDYLEISEDVKDQQYRKQPLESQIAFLYRKEIIGSDISSMMHVLRICGNYGTHNQIGENNTLFSDITHMTVTQLLDWFYKDYLKTDISASQMLSEVDKTVFVIHDNKSEKEKDVNSPQKKKKYLKKRLFSLGFDLMDVVKMVVASIILSLIYYFINR